ncbi:MAG: polysaccharide pyruvyl transferase CsaB [Clostridiaceae bacterium]|nr:polysaccharide pyruvyl transferase CsaB [Clostridiaceae bacterium]
MKLMHIAGGGDKGGAKTHILALCSRLKQDNDLTLVSLRSGEFPEDAEAIGIPTKTFFSKFIPGDYIRLIREAKKLKPDIVHCHGAKANLAGVLIKLFTGATIVTTVHSDYKLDYMHSFIKRNTIGRLNSAALRFFDYYVTVSDNFRRMLVERSFSPLKMMTIYNGLDFSQKAEAPDRREYLKKAGLNYEDGDIVLGIPARLNPVKDISTLLRAFALAKKSVPNLKLIIGGDGDELDKLIALSKELGLEGSVSFMGWLKDVPTFFAACDIDVLSSISESFPYSILEGIREGCAVITSDVGGMRDLIDNGESGYIFTPGDYKTFASYIIDLAKNAEKRSSFAKKLYEKASSKYSLESMAETQEHIYKNIITLEERKRKRRDGILICGAYGRGNTGDEAILKAILDTMRSIDPLVPICVMTRKPKETQLIFGVKAIYTFSVFSFLREMTRRKLFINGGGNLIQDVTSSRSLYFYLLTIWLAKHLGCKVLMYGCGIGHVGKNINRRLAGSLLDRNSAIITLRDPESLRQLADMGVTRPDIRMSADPTLCLSPASPERVEALMRSRGLSPDGKYLAFALRSWKGLNDFTPFTKAAEYAYKKHGLTPVFIPFEQPNDISAGLEASKNLTMPYVLLDGVDDVELMIGLLKRMTAVCAIRLHALVFSATAGVPFVGVSYDVKVDGFMEYADNDCFLRLGDLNAQQLIRQIDKAVSSSSDFEGIAKKLRDLEKENRTAAEDLL